MKSSLQCINHLRVLGKPEHIGCQDCQVTNKYAHVQWMYFVLDSQELLQSCKLHVQLVHVSSLSA